jgi:hypothetical protein
MKINYYRATSALISFKDRLNLLVNKKNQQVLAFLQSISLDNDADDIGVPDVTRICEVTGLKRNKVHPILYDSYVALLESLTNIPHVVTDHIHAIYIRLDDDFVEGKRKSKEYLERDSRMSFWGEFRLPVTPRPGEFVSLEFLDWDVKYPRGVVTEVHHEISGERQRIVIYVNPFRNYYWQWSKLKDQYVTEERNRASRRNQP